MIIPASVARIIARIPERVREIFKDFYLLAAEFNNLAGVREKKGIVYLIGYNKPDRHPKEENAEPV